MATTLFKDTIYSAFGLIKDIKQGEVTLPDIQRPFVWAASKVCDLLHSMYKGFPFGFLIFWETGAEARAVRSAWTRSRRCRECWSWTGSNG